MEVKQEQTFEGSKGSCIPGCRREGEEPVGDGGFGIEMGEMGEMRDRGLGQDSVEVITDPASVVCTSTWGQDGWRRG